MNNPAIDPVLQGQLERQLDSIYIFLQNLLGDPFASYVDCPFIWIEYFLSVEQISLLISSFKVCGYEVAVSKKERIGSRAFCSDFNTHLFVMVAHDKVRISVSLAMEVPYETK